jgi:hypothetical protein
VRQALEADVPSDSEDERFGASDDSDDDPDYKELPDPGPEDSSDDEADQLLEEDNEPGPAPLAPPQGGIQKNARAISGSAASGAPAKRPRAEWSWSSSDLPIRDSPEHKFTVKGNFLYSYTYTSPFVKLLCLHM